MADTGIESLPNEILMEIFSFADALSVSACELVCRHWRDVVGTEYLWRRLHGRLFGGEKSRKRTWREHTIRSADQVRHWRHCIAHHPRQAKGHRDAMLRWAIASGHWRILEAELDGVTDLATVIYPEQVTKALKLAIAKDRPEVARVLLECGARLDPTVMAAACKPSSSLQVIQVLLQHAATDDSEELIANNPQLLPVAIASGRLALIRLLMERGVDPSLRLDRRRTPWNHTFTLPVLIVVSTLRQWEGVVANADGTEEEGEEMGGFRRAEETAIAMMDLLVSHGASVNEVVEDHGTPLTLAARFNADRLCEFLIDRCGADPLVGRPGLRPLFVACRAGAARALTVMEAHVEANGRPLHTFPGVLHYLAHGRQVARARRLLEEVPDPASLDVAVKSNRPLAHFLNRLHKGSHRLDAAMAELLVDHGFTLVTARPLQGLAKAGRLDMLRLLLGDTPDDARVVLDEDVTDQAIIRMVADAAGTREPDLVAFILRRFADPIAAWTQGGGVVEGNRCPFAALMVRRGWFLYPLQLAGFLHFKALSPLMRELHPRLQSVYWNFQHWAEEEIQKHREEIEDTVARQTEICGMLLEAGFTLTAQSLLALCLRVPPETVLTMVASHPQTTPMTRRFAVVGLMEQVSAWDPMWVLAQVRVLLAHGASLDGVEITEFPYLRPPYLHDATVGLQFLTAALLMAHGAHFNEYYAILESPEIQGNQLGDPAMTPEHVEAFLALLRDQYGGDARNAFGTAPPPGTAAHSSQ